MAVDEEVLARKFAVLWPYLDERQRRLLLGLEARQIGHGGISAVARAVGVSWPTVSKAVKELNQPSESAAPAGRARRPGGGRKPLTHRDPGLLAALEALIDPTTRGDPESPLRWTCKSTRQLADALCAVGHQVSYHTVGERLHGLGYSLQTNVKTREGASHPDRDAQFRYLGAQVRAQLDEADQWSRWTRRRKSYPLTGLRDRDSARTVKGPRPGFRGGGYSTSRRPAMASP
jgi:Rhodopirellula transposase DDE domain